MGPGAALHSSLGADPTTWTWGRLHTATFREVTLGESGIAPLEWYFDKGPYPVAGAAGAVDATYYQFSVGYPDPYDSTVSAATDLRALFEMTNMPSYRLDVDLGKLDDARIVITTGQSGNPGDPHYSDLIDAWRLGQQVPLPFSPAGPACGDGHDPQPDALSSGPALLVDLERTVRLDLDPAVLDDAVVAGDRLVGRRVERLAGREVEARQVQGAGQAAARSGSPGRARNTRGCRCPGRPGTRRRR